MTTTLVTGAAGFIGFHLARKLLESGHDVIGVDNVNDYYDVRLKEARLRRLRDFDRFTFHRIDLSDLDAVQALFSRPPSHVVNLAAQAGVRYSVKNPFTYARNNLDAFLNLLECCRAAKVEHFLYASSSSVYGGNKKMPWAVGDNVDHPMSLYAATKKANELMAHSYSSLYGLPTTGLRFFTVYGPWGRPDMAMFLFTEAIVRDAPIQIFNHGNMRRDFTYVDDIVEAVARLTYRPATPDPAWDAAHPDPSISWAPYRLHNIGNHTSVPLMRVVELLEEALGRKARKVFLPMQPGEVEESCAEVESLAREVDFRPATPIELGIRLFVEWYLEYYRDEPASAARRATSA